MWKATIQHLKNKSALADSSGMKEDVLEPIRDTRRVRRDRVRLDMVRHVDQVVA